MCLKSQNAEKVRVGVSVCEQIPNYAFFRVVHCSECQTSRMCQLPSPFTQIWTIRLALSSMLSTLPPPVSTTVAASFLTAIVTPPEAQLTLYNSLILRATAATTFPLLFRIFTSYSMYKPQRHPFYFLCTPKTSFGAPRRPSQMRASQSSFLFLLSVLFSAVLPSCPAFAGGDLQLSSTSHVCCER